LSQSFATPACALINSSIPLAEFDELRDTKNHQKENALLDNSNSSEILQSGFWEFVPFENDKGFSKRDPEKARKSGEMRKRNNRDNRMQEIEKRRILRKNAEMDKSKLIRSNLSNIPRVRSAKKSDNRLSNLSAEKGKRRYHLEVISAITLAGSLTKRREMSL
jgi:hypothetical protein